MSEERRGHIERLQTAVLSRNLSSVADARTDSDYLVASGLASSRTGVDASMHLRTLSSAAELRRARADVLQITNNMNTARHWGLSAAAVQSVADAALVHHMDPACRHCSGRGYRLIPGAPCVSDKKCTHCRGSGRHPLPRKHRDEIDAVLLVLRDADARVEREITALMR